MSDPGAVLPDPPEGRACSRRVGDDPAGSAGPRGASRDGAGGGLGLGSRSPPPVSMNSQPSPSGSSLYRWSPGRAARSAAISATSMPSIVSGARSQETWGHVRGPEASGIADHGQRPPGWGRDQVHGGLEHGHAGALGADQRPGQVEAVLGQQLVQVVAGHPPGELRGLRADQRARAFGEAGSGRGRSGRPPRLRARPPACSAWPARR